MVSEEVIWFTFKWSVKKIEYLDTEHSEIGDISRDYGVIGEFLILY